MTRDSSQALHHAQHAAHSFDVSCNGKQVHGGSVICSRARSQPAGRPPELAPAACGRRLVASSGMAEDELELDDALAGSPVGEGEGDGDNACEGADGNESNEDMASDPGSITSGKKPTEVTAASAELCKCNVCGRELGLASFPRGPDGRRKGVRLKPA